MKLHPQDDINLAIKLSRDTIILDDYAALINSCCFSPDGKLVISSSANIIKINDALTGSNILTLTTDNRPNNIQFSSDGSSFLYNYYDRRYYYSIWNTSTWKCIKTHEAVWSCCYSPDGAKIAVNNSNRIEIYRAITGEYLETLCENNDFERIISLKYSSDGFKILAYYIRHIKIWCMISGKPIKTINYDCGISCSSFSPDGSKIVSGHINGKITIFDVMTNKFVLELIGHIARVHSCNFSPDSLQIISCSDDGTVKLWCAITGKCIKTYEHISYTSLGRFSPDGSQIIYCTIDEVIIINYPTGVR